MSLALYRKYRPSTFAEVIGQEHVTGPLQQALRNDRVHHAYLFSGPRGCGKTTSARILARCLNCEGGPTPEPCGTCQSCRDLAAGGPGSIDVIEIDAASHGGVDDARDLRERAFFAPAASRFKIYVVDEAHMVTTAGFNALLKVVEEPPEHLKFIFATTEPDKVIGTIRSRTHHYPFRLIPPSVLRDHLEEICQREQVKVETGVLPLVVRAGAGSARDALSVLDQLLAGAGPEGVTYAMATGLLGYTDATLLDDVTDAFAAHDGAAVFQAVDRVIEGGHDPRRFVADLLERFRDLVILDAVPEVGAGRLIDAPVDQLERMRAQAGRFGTAELSRAADVLNTGLTEMRGATAPRLQLELICARVLLPAADDTERGAHARIDRLERRISLGSADAATPAQPPRSAPKDDVRRPSPPTPAPPAVSEPAAAATPPGSGAAAEPREAAASRGTAAEADPTQTATALRRMWPEVLDKVKARRRYTWMILIDNVQVAAVADGVLTLAFAEEGKRRNFVAGGSDVILREALIDVLGVDWRIDAVLDPAGAAQRSAAPAPAVPGPTKDTGQARDRGRAAPAASRGSGARGVTAPAAAVAPEDDAVSVDDPAAEDEGVTGAALVERMLGGRTIGEWDEA